MKVDSWGHPALSEKQVIAIAENMIPTALRPYYVDISVMRQTLAEPYSEWNTDIVVYFKYPVAGGPSDESRYAHSDLFHLERDLKELYIDVDSKDDEWLADYDDETWEMPIKEIKPLTRKIVWHKPGYNGED